jgi:hypothetical protein
MQKKGESLWKFIQRFYNKNNVILEVDDRSIIMFFKKVLRDSSLICKLIMKNSRTSKEMLAITNKYALAEKATLDNRDAMEKELSQSDWPDTSKNNDKKRKSDCSVKNIEWPHGNKTKYWPWPGVFEGFLYRICIFTPRENTRLRTKIGCKGMQMKS